jgi:lactoylglutathione lyase
MPSINHVAIWVLDLEAMCTFYRTAFSATVGPLYRNPTKRFSSRFLTFEGGSRLELMHADTVDLAKSEPGAQRIGLTHLAFSLGSEAAVNELTEQLRAVGTPVVDGPRRTGDGYYESVVLDPEGNRIELTA